MKFLPQICYLSPYTPSFGQQMQQNILLNHQFKCDSLHRQQKWPPIHLEITQISKEYKHVHIALIKVKS